MTDQFHIDFKAIRGRAAAHLSGLVCAMSVTHDPFESSESFCFKVLGRNTWFGSNTDHKLSMRVSKPQLSYQMTSRTILWAFRRPEPAGTDNHHRRPEVNLVRLQFIWDQQGSFNRKSL